MKRGIFVVALLVSLGGGGIWWTAFRAAVLTDRASEALRSEAKRLQAETTLAAGKADVLAKRSSELRRQLMAPKVPLSATAPESARLEAARANFKRRLDLISGDPNLQRVQLEIRSADLRRKYGPLFKTLERPQADALRTALVARDEKLTDLADIAWVRGWGRDDPVITKLQQQAETDFQVAAREILDPASYERLERFEGSRDARILAETFVGASLVAGMPGTEGQVEQLTTAIMAAAEPTRTPRNPETLRINWSEVDRLAAGILSPAQVVLFQTVAPLGGLDRQTNELVQKVDDAIAADARSTQH